MQQGQLKLVYPYSYLPTVIEPANLYLPKGQGPLPLDPSATMLDYQNDQLERTTFTQPTRKLFDEKSRPVCTYRQSKMEKLISPLEFPDKAGCQTA